MEIRKVKITGINEIHPGDHICNRMPNGLWHHEIVTMKFPSRDMYEAIGFMNNRAGYYALQQDMREFTKVKNSSNGELYHIEYQITDQTIPLYSNDEVVLRAKLALRGLNNANRSYSILTNNCEHFAIWCKCGIHVSSHTEALKNTFIDKLKPAIRIAAAVACCGIASAAVTCVVVGQSSLTYAIDGSSILVTETSSSLIVNFNPNCWGLLPPITPCYCIMR